MPFSKNILNVAILTSSAVLLSACGGSDSGQPAAPIASTKATAQFSGDLTIKDAQGQSQIIAGRTTDESAAVPAYGVKTSISSILEIGASPLLIASIGNDHVSLSYQQELVFQLDAIAGQKLLTAFYNPILKRFEQFEYAEIVNNEGNLETITYRCAYNEPLFEACQNIISQFNPLSGQATFDFRGTTLKGGRDNKPLTLTGKLNGTLSIAPQTLANIPKTTLDTLKINGQNTSVLASTHNSLFSVDEILFEDGKQLLIAPFGDNQLRSTLLQPNDQNVFSKQNYFLTNNAELSSQDQSDSQKILFKQALYQPLEADTPQNYTLNGTIQIHKPTQILQISSWHKIQDFTQEYVPSRVNITLINHNERILETNNLKVHLRDNKVYGVSYSDLVISPDSSTITRLIELDYQCDSKEACKNITVEPNGFGVKFNNAVLRDSNNSNQSVNSVITLNGGLIYKGR